MPENQTKSTTVVIEQDTITVKTDLDVPKNFPTLPIFAGQGWIYASVESQNPESKTLLIEDKETGATLKFTPHWERSDILPKSHRHHSRKAKDTFEVGDFLVQDRFTYDGDPQLRVLIHPDITDPDPKVVVEPLNDGGE